jgi:hypothetical protein
MAGTLTISTLSDGTNSTSATNCISGSAKAWVNFNGTNGSIRASYNVSSVTKNSAGLYTVNFTNALSDTNYAVFATVGIENNGTGTTAGFACNGSANGNHYLNNTTTSTRIVTAYSTTGIGDYTSVYVSVFR